MINKRIRKEKKKYSSSAIKKRWVVNNFSIVVLAIILMISIIAGAVTTYHYDSLKGSLANRANTIAGYINRYMTASYNQFYDFTSELVAGYSDKDKVEVQVVDTYGRVMFSSTGLMAGYIPSTPDVTQAIAEGIQVPYVGEDQLSGETVACVTSPIFNQNSTVIGAVRFISSTKIVERQLINIYLGLILVGVIIVCLIGIPVVTQLFRAEHQN